MKKGHMVGISPTRNDIDFKLLRDLGVKWVRKGYPFPFADEKGTLSKRFLDADESIERFRAEGFEILCSIPGPGVVSYDSEEKITKFHRSAPAYFGEASDEKYFEKLYEATVFLGEFTKGRIQWWQIANEPDIDIFYGPLNEAQNIRFLTTAAKGILKSNPDAQCGINLGYINDYARVLMREMYAIPNSPFAYLGIDGYMGSWQPGGPKSWVKYIEETAALSGKPIIINEWGFSSLQWGEKYTDPERKKHYNQGVCYDKYWGYTWGQGRTPEAQALYVSECLPIFAEHPAVIGNFFFRWDDAKTCWQCGEPDCPAECAWGCVDVDEKPKPAYYALQEGFKTLFA